MTKPFFHEVRVRWADCDPARIAYTGRIPQFALEAIDEWWEHHVGEDWFRMNIDHDIGTPFVHLSVDFKLPVTPRHTLMCQVELIHLGGSSVRFRVTGRQNDTICFVGEFVEVFVAAEAHEKIPVPKDIRPRLEAALVD